MEENTELHLSYAVVELRRTAFRYVDQRGKLAADLAKSYETVSFGADANAIPLSFLEILTVELDGETRRGTVNGHHAVVEDRNPVDINRFAKESVAFLRTVERQLEIERYDRIGVRFIFELPDPDVSNAARQYFGKDNIEDWQVSGFDTRIERNMDEWQIGLRIFAGLTAIKEGDTYDGKTRFDIDQYKLSVPSSTALRFPVLECYSRALKIVEQFAQNKQEQV